MRTREQYRVGLPGSIERYVSTAEWGKNKYAIMAYDQWGYAYCVAAQTTREGAERYAEKGYVLVDLTNWEFGGRVVV